MAEFNAPKDTVREVKLSGDKRDELREYLKEQINSCITDRTRLIEKCKQWVKQSNSRRKRKDATARDANIDMPLTRQRMMQNSARLLNPIFQQDPIFVTKARNPAAEDISRAVEKVIDYISDQIDYRTVCDEWVEQFQTFPFGVVKTPFIHEEERIVRWQELSDEMGMPDYEDYNNRKMDGQKVTARKSDDGSERLFVEVDDSVVIRSGVYPEVVPFEDFFVPMCSKDVRTADWVMHRIWMTKKQIEEQVRKGVYNKKDGDCDVLEMMGDPKSERERLIKFEPDDKSGSMEEETSKQYEIMEAYLKWKVGGGDPTEIIVSFDRESGAILRCIYNFYHSYRRPFVEHCYKKNQGSILGTPLTYILEPLHVAYSAAFCQRLDAASKANESLWCFPPNSRIEEVLSTDTLRTSIVETTASKDEVFELKLSQPFSQLPELEGRLVQEADKLSGLSEYSFGQEQIDRPTASGQIQIIEESKQPQYMQLERFRKSLAEVCKHALARYKQFYPEGLEMYMMQEDPQGQQWTDSFFKWPDGVIEKSVFIETKVSSASMSKSLRKQELVALIDKLGQIYQQMMQYAQAAADPMNPVALPSAKILNGLWTVVNEMLTEFEVGKKDAMNPRLVEEMQVVQQIQQTIQQMGQQINQLGQQNAQLQQQNAALQQGGPPQPGVPGQPQQPPGVPGPGGMGAPAPGQGNPQMAQGPVG